MTSDKLRQDRVNRRIRANRIAFLALIWFASVYTTGHVLAAKLLGRF